jgi:hypothetical protein
VLCGGGEQAATATNREGNGSLAFGQRKEKRERASVRPKGGGVSLGWPAGQGSRRGKATQEDGRGDGPGEGGSLEGGEEGAGRPGGEGGEVPAGLGRDDLGRTLSGLARLRRPIG